jgi:hypothetical protein
VKITIFTSNQPRHTALIEQLAGIADEIIAIQECSTLFPGQIPDFFRKSLIMQDYFSRVLAAEKKVFGNPRPLPKNVRSMPIKMSDLNLLDMQSLTDALASDVYVVFGASFIKSPLIDFLVEHRAINIHMGISPFYRGSSTNFWAMYDRRPQYVGATIHLLSKGLDSGPVLFHAFPKPAEIDPFVYGMLAVRAAHQSFADCLRNEMIFSLTPILQDKSKELRYTRNADFTDEVASEYLARLPSPKQMFDDLKNVDRSKFLCVPAVSLK